MIYTGIHMPIFNGGDCSALEGAVNVFTVVSIVITSMLACAGLKDGALISSLFCLVVGVAISPFMLYVYVFLLALFFLCVVLYLIFHPVLYSIQSCMDRWKIERARSRSQKTNSTILSDVKIDSKNIQRAESRGNTAEVEDEEVRERNKNNGI